MSAQPTEGTLREAFDTYNWQHRWDALARFNSRRHAFPASPEYVALMAEQQAAFDREAALRAALARPAEEERG